MVQPQQNGAIANRTQNDLKPVERATRTINDALARETQYPELDAYVSREYFKSRLIRLLTH